MSDPFRQLVNQYARAVDRGQFDQLCAIFTEDGRIHGPGFDFRGRAGFAEMFVSLADNFKITQHRFFNQMIDINGSKAGGETYAQAAHIVEDADGKWVCHDWAIRYQDRFIKQGEMWKFQSRQLIVDWVQTTPASSIS